MNRNRTEHQANKVYPSRARAVLILATLPLAILPLFGCETARQTNLLAASAAAGYLAQSPSNELEQVYYLGIFDPDEQVPQMMYRVTIRAQASSLNWIKYGSGWVPSWAVDSLGSRIEGGLKLGDDSINYSKGKEDDANAQLQVGRRLVMFGPDGFREAPKDHRLVIVMGASPENFFKGVDDAIGSVAGAQLGAMTGPIREDVMAAALAHKQRQLDLATFSAGGAK